MAQASSDCAMIPETAAESLSDGKALFEDNREQHGNGTSSIGNFTSQNSKPISNNNEAEIQNENTTYHDMAEKERPKLQDEESELREQQNEESLLEESFDSLPPPPPTTPKPPRQAQQDEEEGDHDGESELESLPPYDEYSPAKSPGNSSVVRTLSFESSSVVSNGSSIGSASASGGVPGRLGRVGRAGRMGIMFGLAGKAPRHHDRGESSDGSAVNGVGGGSSAGSTHGTGNGSGNGTGILTRFLGMKKTLTGSFAGHSPDDGISGNSASGGVGVVRSDNATIATAPKVGAENGQLERVEDRCDDDAGGDDESTHIHDNLNHDMKKEEQELQQQCHHANQVDSTPATVASFSTDSQTSDENHTSIAETPIFSPFLARDSEGKGEKHEKAANIPNDIEKKGDTDDNNDEDGNVITNKGKSLGKSPTPSVNDEVSATPTAHALSEFASVATAPANASASSIASTSGLGEEVTVFPPSSNDNEKSNPPSPPTEPALPPSQNKVLSENQSEIGNTVNNRTDSSLPTAMESNKQSTEYDDGSSHELMDSSNHVEGSSSHHNDGLLSRLFRKSSTRKPSLSMEEAGSDANAKVDADESSVVNGATAKNYSTAVLATTENFTSESSNKIENGDDSSAALKQSSSNGGVESSIEDGDLLVSFYGVVKPSLSTSDSDEASETNSWDDLLVDFADSSKGAKGSKPLGGEEMEKKGESTEAESNRAESKNNESSTSPEEVEPTPTEESTAEKMDAAVSETSKLPSAGVIAGTAADEDENMLVSFYSKDEVQDLLVSFYGVVKPSSSLGEVVQKQNSSKSQQNDGGRSTNSSGDDVNKILADERNTLPLSADSLENDTTTSFKSNSSDVSNADEPEDASISTDNFLPEIMSAADSNSRLGSPTFSIDTAEMESSPSKSNNDQVDQQNSAPFDRMPSDMKVILKDEITGVTVKEFFEIAWSEGASSDQDDHVVPPLYGPWLSSCGKRNVFIQQWEEIEADNERIDSFTHRRRVAFDFEKSTLGIHSKVKVHHEQNYRLTDDQLVLHMTISMKGFPYAECFRVEVRHLVTKRRSQEIAAVDVEIGLKVVFVKSTIIEKKIRNNTSEETIKSQSDLLQTIIKACSEEVTRRSLGEKSPDSSSGDAPVGNSAEGMTALETTDMTSIQNELQPVNEEFVVGDACEIKTEGITMDATVEPNLENSNVGRDVEIKQQTAGDESISNAEYFSVETGTDCSGFGAVYANGNETADKQQSLNFKDFPVDLIVEPSDIKQPIDKAGEVANQDEDNTASITNKPENTKSQLTLEGLIIKRGFEEASSNVEEARMYQVGSNPADSGSNERAEYVSVFVAGDSELKKCNADDVVIKVHRNDSTEAAKECDVMICSKENDLSSLLAIETPSASNESVPILIAAPQDQSFNSSDSSNIPTNMYKKKVVELNHNGDKQSVPLSRIAGQDSSLPATSASIDKLMESNGNCNCFWCPDVLFTLFRGSKPKAAFVSSAPKPDFDINNMKGSVDDFREELLALMDQGGISPTKRDRILQEVLVIQQSLDRISSISMNNIDQNAIV